MGIKIDKLIKSRRKTFALEITQDARLIVRSPLKASLDTIQKILKEKEAWISKKLQEMQSRQQKPKKFQTGEKFLFLGEFYELVLAENQKTTLDLNKNFILKADSHSKAGQIFENWYKQEAKVILEDRVEYFADLYGFKHKNIRITSANKRWGSCSADNNLNFAWRLIMAPMEVVDYVVVHELGHIKQKNHSKKFWQIVEKILPDYKKQRKWLKDNGHLLTV